MLVFDVYSVQIGKIKFSSVLNNFEMFKSKLWEMSSLDIGVFAVVLYDYEFFRATVN